MPWLSEFVLSNPVALFSLLALLIPVLIHLFNPSRGVLVYVGNIKLIEKAKNLKVTEIKIRQWLLLILRLIIFSLLTLILANLLGPNNQAVKEGQSVFISANWFNKASDKDKRQLAKSHPVAKFYRFERGFPPIENVNDTNILVGQLETINRFRTDSLIAELIDSTLLTNDTFIYTTNLLNQFSAQRNLASLILPKGSTIHWKMLDQAINHNNSMTVQVYYDTSRTEDISYFNQAFKILNESSASLTVQYFNIPSSGEIENENETPRQQSDESENEKWIIWLSDSSLPTSLYERIFEGSNLITDNPSSEIQLSRAQPLSLVRVGLVDIKLTHKLPPLNDDHSVVIWKDLQQRPLLSQLSKLDKRELNSSSGSYFQFHSRFNPAWSDLVEGIQFPIVLSKVLSLSGRNQVGKLIGQTELPEFKPTLEVEDIAHKTFATSYRAFLLLLLSMIWLLERWLSERIIRSHD
ncbi:MAG: BatA domain-containing protein [Kangiellaceae bacterium]|nr:BatA domain-containing protein [Kangiellaceae bacterium]